jgi:hypothetical protein
MATIISIARFKRRQRQKARRAAEAQHVIVDALMRELCAEGAAIDDAITQAEATDRNPPLGVRALTLVTTSRQQRFSPD